MLPLIHRADYVAQAPSIYLRRKAWVSFPLRIVSTNRSKGMTPMGDTAASRGGLSDLFGAGKPWTGGQHEVVRLLGERVS